MAPNDIFELIKKTKYNNDGLDVDWQVVEFSDSVFLLFQETRSSIDWKVNFDFPAKPYKNQESPLLIHRGYAKAYKSCNDKIMEAFISKCKGCNKVPYISGWSYGGAMAQIASEDFFYRTGIKPNLITFGAPKVAFGKKTRNYLESCICGALQFAHRSDIVPKVPPFFLKYGRVPVGKFNFIGLFKPEKYHCEYGNAILY